MDLLDLFGGNSNADDEENDADKKASTSKKSSTAKDSDAAKPGGLDAILSIVGNITSGGGASGDAKPAGDPSSMLGTLLSTFTGKGSANIGTLAGSLIPLLTQQGLLDEFKTTPVKALEKVIGIDLPDELIDPLIPAIQAKLSPKKTEE